MKTVETLTQEGIPLKEVELMLTVDELQSYAKYCLDHDVKFNDWIRQLAEDAMRDSKVDAS